MKRPASENTSRGATPSEFGPWQYGLGLALWLVFIVLFILRIPRSLRFPVGTAAAGFWTWGVLLRRRAARALRRASGEDAKS